MDYALGWEIIHRDEKEMEALIPPESIKIKKEEPQDEKQEANQEA